MLFVGFGVRDGWSVGPRARFHRKLSRLTKRCGRMLGLLNRSARHRKLIGAPVHMTGTVRMLAHNCCRSTRGILASTLFRRGCSRVIVIGSVSFFSLYRRRVLPFCNGMRITCVPGNGVAKLDGVTHIMSVFDRHLRIRRHLARRVGSYVRRALGPRNIVIIVRTGRVYVRVHNIRGRGSVAAADSCDNMFGSLGAHRRFVDLLENRDGEVWVDSGWCRICVLRHR